VTTLRIETPRVYKPLLTPSRYKGAYGGRGSGKSHFFAEMLVERCVIDPTTRVVCVREVQKSISQSVRQLVEDKIAKLGVGHLFDVPIDRSANIKVLDARGTPQGLIAFQGMQNHTNDSIKSLEGYDIAWVEEAQSISQRSLDLLRPTIRKPGSELWFGWNPSKDTDPVDVLLRGPNPPRNAVVVEANYTDNPWFPDELRDELEGDRERDPDKYAHVWLGAYQGRSEARVFRNWRVGDGSEFITTHDTVFRFGADWGFAIDPTVLVRGYLDGRKLYVDWEAYEEQCEVDQTPALFDRIPRARDFRITADSARPETVSYMRRHGFPKIVSALKGQGSVEDGISFLQSFDIIVHPRCENVIRELSSYSYKVDRQTDEVLPMLEDKDNHTIDALRYALEGLRRAGVAPKAEVRDTRRPRDIYTRNRDRDGDDYGGGMYG
jgi:phage terminase large subunit